MKKINNRSLTLEILEGGEKMQIEGLGFYQTVATQIKKQPNTEGKQSFSQVFQSISSVTNETQGATPTKELTEAEMKDLLSFLNNEDILDVEGGLKLLDEALSNSNEDVLSMIENYLGISPNDLQKMITNLLEKLNLSAGSTDENPHALSQLVKLVEALQNTSPSELVRVIDQDSKQLIKAVKLYELIAKNKDSLLEEANKLDLKSLSTKLSNLLEQSLMKNDQTTRLAYLKQTFSSLNSSTSLKEKSMASSTGNNEVINGSVQFLQMSKPEVLTLTVQNGSKQVSTEQLIKQFESILSRSQFTNINGSQRLLLQLNPAHLGSLRIELVQQDSVMIAKIVTSTQAAKEAIEGQLNHLKQAFSSQNIQVERLEISQQSSSQERFFNRDGEREQQERQEQTKHNKEQKPGNDFTLFLEEEVLNTEA